MIPSRKYFKLHLTEILTFSLTMTDISQPEFFASLHKYNYKTLLYKSNLSFYALTKIRISFNFSCIPNINHKIHHIQLIPSHPRRTSSESLNNTNYIKHNKCFVVFFVFFMIYRATKSFAQLSTLKIKLKKSSFKVKSESQKIYVYKALEFGHFRFQKFVTFILKNSNIFQYPQSKF